MQIQVTPEILDFLDQCRYNLQHDQKYTFIGLHVTKKNEKKVQQQLHDAGFHEFQGDPSLWPSLFIDTKQWLNSSYHQNIRLDFIKDQTFSYEKIKTKGYELFNTQAIIKDPQRRLNDSMVLRAMDQHFESIYLYQDDEIWMMDAPSEANTNDIAAQHAVGHVVTFGLGIGYYLYQAMHNKKVKSITVVEQSQEVIAMFQRFLQPQFPQNIPLHIIHGDAFALFNEHFLDNFDSIYVDIWKSSNDGLECITTLLEQCLPTQTLDFWIEDSCYEIIWTLIFIYFDQCVHGPYAIAQEYQFYFNKIQYYFDNLNTTCHTVEQLQYYMYDNTIIRQILHTKI